MKTHLVQSRAAVNCSVSFFWEGHKGIDDAAKAANVTSITFSIPEWFATLAGEPLEEVKKVWNEIGYQPAPIN